MNQVAIVILNYENYQETEKCIESIINKRLDVVGIVVVDNASQNESLTYLKNKYQNNRKIKIIRSKKNLGFAGGNNLGIRAAKSFWNTEFVLLLNSDTVILEEDYLIKLLNEYKLGVGVMMTSVLRLNGRYTPKNYGTYDMLGVCLDTAREVFSYYNVYFPSMIKRGVRDRVGPWVSGCDILLTPDYFKTFRGLYPLTFLYREEYILAMMLRKAKLECKVVEDAHILHAESKSTPLGYKEGTRKKQKMVLKNRKHILFVRIMPLKILQLITNYGWKT